MSDLLQPVLDAAWHDHAEHPDAVADRIERALPLVTRGEEVRPFVGLAVHVFGEHLGQWQRGLELLGAVARLPASRDSQAAAAAIRNGLASLRYAGGDMSAAADLAPADRAQALASAAAILTGRGELRGAVAALDEAVRAAEAQPLPPGHGAQRALAVAGNNLSAALQEKPELAADERAAMISAAETGLAYWTIAGTWLQEERAHYRLARCLLRAGELQRAHESIARCIDVCGRNDAPAFERFFGFAVRALIERAMGRMPAQAQSRAEALTQYERIPDGEKPACERELGELEASALPGR